MKSTHKIIIITIFLLVVQVCCIFAQDLFTVEIIGRTATSITVRCNIDVSYQPFNFCDARYYWDFGDGHTQIDFKYPTEEYSSITYTYDMTGSESSLFCSTISLHLFEFVNESDEEGYGCKYKTESFLEQSICVDNATKIDVSIRTESTNNYATNGNISFYCTVNSLSGVTDNLEYSIEKRNLINPGDVPATGSLAIVDIGIEKDLEFTITPTVEGNYIFEFKIERFGNLVFSELIEIAVTNDGGGGGGTAPIGCPPAGTFDLSITIGNPSNGSYPVAVNILCNNSQFYNNKIYLSAVSPTNGLYYPIYNKPYIDNKVYTHSVTFNIQDTEPQKWKYRLQVLNGQETAECGLNSVYKEILLPVPTFDPTQFNQVTIDADGSTNGSKYLSISTEISKCAGTEIINPNDPKEAVSWLNILYIGGIFSATPYVNITGQIREAEIRIHDGGIIHPTLLIDKFGKTNAYRSIWFTQKSVPLSYLEYPTGVVFPYDDTDPNVSLYRIAGQYYVVDLPSTISLEFLVANLENGNLLIERLDEFGDLIDWVKIPIKISSCGSTVNWSEADKHEFYIANVNTSLNFSNTLSPKNYVVVNATNKITFSPGSKIYNGTNVVFTTGNCIAMKSVDLQEQELAEPLTRNAIDFSAGASILVYPNPSNGHFNIEFSNVEEIAHFEIYNSLGQRIYSQRPGNRIEVVDLNAQEGLYIIRTITTDNKVENFKIVIQK